MKTLIMCLTLLGFSLFNMANAETRGEILEKNDKSDFAYSSHSQDQLNDRKSINLINIADFKKLGFYEVKDSTSKSDHVLQVIVSAYTKPPEVTGVLVVRIYCLIPDSIIPISPRYKTVKWSIKSEDSETEKRRDLLGEVQTDGEGFVRIQISSSGSVLGRKVILNIAGKTSEIELGKGPYEVFIPENACRKL